MIKNFKREIEYLLSEVPPEQWQDPTIRGILYEITPWHGTSSVTVQTAADDPSDIGGWTYYFSADSDGSRIQEEIRQFQQVRGRLAYHRLLLEAAEALLSIDFSPYGQPETLNEDGFPYGPFRLQVYDVDGSFRLNYCEYLLARRLEQTGF